MSSPTPVISGRPRVGDTGLGVAIRSRMTLPDPELAMGPGERGWNSRLWELEPEGRRQKASI